MDAVPALELDTVTFTWPARRRRPARTTVDAVSLSIGEGEHVALLGPNGSGKSTLLRIACGLLEPGAGRVRILGRPIAERRAALGVVFQSASLDPHLTARENLELHAKLGGRSTRDARDLVAERLDAAGLREVAAAPMKAVSGGQRRRVDLCRALLHEPRILLLDEATTGLDPVARRDFIRHVESEVEARGMAVLATTHLVDEADRADRVVLMHDGRVIADGPPAALRAELGARRLAVHDARWTVPPDEATAWSRTGDGWSRPLPPDEDGRAFARLVSDGVPFSVAPPTLEDVFELRTGRRLGVHDAADDAAAEEAAA